MGKKVGAVWNHLYFSNYKFELRDAAKTMKLEQNSLDKLILCDTLLSTKAQGCNHPLKINHNSNQIKMRVHYFLSALYD